MAANEECSTKHAREIAGDSRAKRNACKATQARDVLEDCRMAHHELLQQDLSGRLWRIRWVNCLTLLRVVGHVLRKVDAGNSESMKMAISEWWENLKAQNDSRTEDDRIFHDFIEEFRNNALKEYRVGAGQVVIRGRAAFALSGQNQPPVGHPLPDLHEYPVRGGVFDGRDQRGLVMQAIDWWEKQIQGIEKCAQEIQLELHQSL